MQRRSTDVQGLVFGGLMAALAVVFSLVPLLTVFMPIPLVLAYVRYGGRTATLTALVSTLFSMAFLGFIPGLLLIPAGVLPGLVFGYGFRHGWRPLSIGLVAVLVFFLGYAMEYGITRALMFEGRDPFVVALEAPMMKSQLETTLNLMEQVMVPVIENPTPQQALAIEQSRAMIERFRQDPVGVTWTLLPTALFLIGAFSSWVNYMLCRLTLPRFGHQVPEPTPFGQFRLPVWLIWVYGALMLLAPQFLRADMTEMAWWAKLLLNIFTPLGLIITLAGWSVAYGFLRKRGLKKGMATLLTVMATFFLGQLGIQLFIILAIWDTIFDFRGLGHGVLKRPNESN